jgi:uncharacterized membrane protein YeaQ/YmgE (transglycosylase-associated protein family)
MSHLIYSLIVGAICGAIAEQVLGFGFGWILAIVLGVVGGIVGDYIFTDLLHFAIPSLPGVLGNIIFGAIGSIIVLYAYKMISSRN